ncbi:uncharacterized protein N7483_006072 [Penicillium malachiteum]|uniref:uncharacterized protein n=1 Tax=Penicillium malachiteum TaxID=1324776 RepID=UPI002546BFB0|nr:uncharacterized protein N7483_006072 [Penicillium malachiteum]KAJ5731564.1 hypothetical protein N7483_006072 [Penicillium malachiteum]
MDPDEPYKRVKREEGEVEECLDLISYNLRQGDVTLQEALIELKERMSGLILSMGLSDFIINPNSTLHKLSKEAEQLWEFQCSETHIVGFIGDSGAGKSSVINSLLDQTELTRSNGDGAACTSVVTEFRSTDITHPDPYTIEIEFMESEEIKELLEELLRNFHAFHCPSIYSQVPSDGRENVKLAAERAWQTLESLFYYREELTYEFLSEDNEESEDKSEKIWDAIIKTLETWTNEALAQRSDQIQGLVMAVTTDGLQGCRDYLDYLMASSHENGDLVLWPFINLIRVYIQSPVLQGGLVVADLPGFRDMNFARVRATERYLFHQCDGVFNVSDISRCVTDQSITEIRSRCSMKPQQIEIIPEEAARGQTEIRDIQCQIRATKISIKRAPSTSDRSQFAIEQTELTAKLEELELQRTEYLVNHRNARVETQLKKKHNDIGVFCLLPAASQLRHLTEYLQNQVPALLGSICQWTLAGSDVVAQEQATALQRSLDEVEKAFRQWHYATYAAFCRANGTYRKKNQGREEQHCWNTDLTAGPRQNLEPRMDKVISRLNSKKETLNEEISKVLDEGCIVLQNHKDDAPISIGNMIPIIKTRKVTLTQHVDRALTKMIKNIEMLSMDMFEGHASSFMESAMRPAYLKCASKVGRGSHNKRQKAMQKHPRSSEIFETYEELTKRAYQNALKKHFEFWSLHFSRQIDGIIRDLSTIVVEKEKKSEAEQNIQLTDEIIIKVEDAKRALEVAQRALEQETNCDQELGLITWCVSE